MGLPEEETALLEGSVPSSKREALWKERRVFFTTPHVVVNDISNGICDANQFTCMVFDEAHKATANYPYTLLVMTSFLFFSILTFFNIC
jgi:ERCC4-related helicase